MRKPIGGGILAFVAACSAATGGRGAPQADGPVAARPVLDASGKPCCRDTGYPTPVQLVLRTRADWAAAWKELSVGRASLAPSDMDFAREMVLVVTAGTRATAGWTLAVESVEMVGGALRVSVLETSPGRNCMTAQVLTHPAAAVVVPRFEGSVAFSTRSVAKDCR
jgi:hypothetical protein